MITREEVKEFVHALETAEFRNDVQFQQLFSRGMTLLNLADIDVAREFGASRPTVTRWRNGTNAPHPAMRKHVYDLLERHANRTLKRLPQRSAFGSYEAAPPVPLAARKG
jgi:transcriptional regulator with XRE-family HTH domain